MLKYKIPQIVTLTLENLKTSDGKPWKKKNRTKSPPSK